MTLIFENGIVMLFLVILSKVTITQSHIQHRYHKMCKVNDFFSAKNVKI